MAGGLLGQRLIHPIDLLLVVVDLLRGVVRGGFGVGLTTGEEPAEQAGEDEPSGRVLQVFPKGNDRGAHARQVSTRSRVRRVGSLGMSTMSSKSVLSPLPRPDWE